jgi:hypothetical protein
MIPPFSRRRFLQTGSLACMANAMVGMLMYRSDGTQSLALLRDIEKRTQIWGDLWRDAGGQPPGPRDLSLWAINRFCRMCWLALTERKQEWLPEGSHCAGLSPAQWGSENLSTASLRRSGCFPAERVLLRGTGGYVRVRRLSRGIQPLCSYARP